MYHSPAEKSYRFNIFLKNKAEVETENSKATNYKFALNHFSDMTSEEFKVKYLGYKTNETTRNTQNADVTQEEVNQAPTEIDWRQKGAVTPVKNQMQCGSCWAFSTTGALEGAYFLKTGNLHSFSEQQLNDCSYFYGNLGCNGGLPENSFKYTQEKGIISESDYPYKGRDNFCHYKKFEDKVVTKNTGAINNAPTEAALLVSVAAAPTSIGIFANPIMQYSSGIYDNTAACPADMKKLDHAILTVGYGVENGKKYWIVKNSWTATWGEQGYIRFARDTSLNGGICGLALDTNRPTFD